MQQHDHHEQNDEPPQGVFAANGFPYGLDPRDFNVGPLEYQQALRHHREMETSNRKHEEHLQHMHIMAEETAKKAAADAELEAKYYWLQPITAFFRYCGGAFWFAFWVVMILLALISLNDWQAQRDAQWCLKDVAKCESIAKGVPR